MLCWVRAPNSQNERFTPFMNDTKLTSIYMKPTVLAVRSARIILVY